jgi:GNAT superfamily N-acetyltransferase
VAVIEIVRATSTRNPGFIQLLGQVFVERGLSVPDTVAIDRLEAAIRQDRVRFYMALRDNRVIGVVSITFGFSTLQMRPFALVGDLYVHPGHRGIGAASALLLAAMDGAHGGGCGTMTTRLDDVLGGLFERFGWQRGVEHMETALDLAGPPPSLTFTASFRFD